MILDQHQRPMTLITGLESWFCVIDYPMVAQHGSSSSKTLAASRHGPARLSRLLVLAPKPLGSFLNFLSKPLIFIGHSSGFCHNDLLLTELADYAHTVVHQ